MVTARDRLAEFPQDPQSPPASCAAARASRLGRGECGLAAPRFSFNEPPGSGEAGFLRAEPRGPTLTVHYPGSEKPRIWSLAHTAAAGAGEGAPSTPPRSPERPAIPGQPPGPGRRPVIPRHSGCEETSRVTKAFGNPPFALQGLPLTCAPCPRRREPAVQCQYPSGAEGSGPPTVLGVSVQKTPAHGAAQPLPTLSASWACPGSGPVRDGPQHSEMEAERQHFESPLILKSNNSHQYLVRQSLPRVT